MQMAFIHKQNRCVNRGVCAALILAASQLLSCSTPPPAPQLSAEQKARRENAIGIELATQFERRVQTRRDPEIASYLRDLCVTLKSGAPELKDIPIAVMVIRDQGTRWRNYALPGIRVYISSGLLKSVSYENELASAAALELGLVRTKAAIENLDKFFPPGGANAGLPELTKERVDFFGRDGILSFTDDQLLQAVPSAIELLYKAGYDFRGMVSLLARYQAAPVISPFPQPTVSKLLEKTREVIAQYAPLRNPIVRSDRFIEIRKRMRKL